MYMKYHETMTDLQMEFDRLVEEFCSNYTWEVSRAQARIGDLFNLADYPNEATIRSKFAFRISYEAINDPNDFRVNVGEEQAEILKEHMNKHHNARFNGVMDSMWKRVHKLALRMSERLRVAEVGEKVSKTGALPIHDSMVDEAMIILDLLAACNVTGDSQQEAIYKKFEDTMYGVTTDGLRMSATLRAETKASIDDIILNLPSLEM
tara:strand:- start:221 stop:841 length:621 start_codon:yes stop_codon:yes gene_type:complete